MLIFYGCFVVCQAISIQYEELFEIIARTRNPKNTTTKPMIDDFKKKQQGQGSIDAVLPNRMNSNVRG